MFLTISSTLSSFFSPTARLDVEIPAEVKQLFGYVNYFVPVTAMLAIGTTWLTAIGVYYLYQTILRWAKTIK